jgi:multicomponent K+:H+ antiporter subunit E
MKRLLPYPLASLALAALWLLLNGSLSPGQVLLAALLGIAAPLLTRRLQPLGYPRLRRPVVLLRLLAMATVEVLRSCVNVCSIIVSGRGARVNAQFIRVPLTTRHPHALAALSCLINMTPGTVWVEILPDGHELVLHVFDLHDAGWWVETITTRYEQPLIEIFGKDMDHGDPA